MAFVVDSETRVAPARRGPRAAHLMGPRPHVGDPAPSRDDTHGGRAPVAGQSSYASSGGQEHTRLRSPYAWSMRRTGTQYLPSRSEGTG